MDNLKEFITENRSGFDSDVPSLKVWANIDRQLDQRSKPKIFWLKRIRAIAAVAALLVVSLLIGFQLGTTSSETKSLADVSAEHAEMEHFFQEQINQKMAQLASYRQDGFVQADFRELDAVYEELKQELKTANANGEDQVIQAMINTYQTKIDILEQVLEKVKTTEQTNLKTEENEVSL